MVEGEGGNLVCVELALGDYFEILLGDDTDLLILGLDDEIYNFANFGRFGHIEISTHIIPLISVHELQPRVGVLHIVLELNLDVIHQKLMRLE